MSLIDRAVEANHNYARTYNTAFANPPAPKIVVVTCMDPRLSNLPGIYSGCRNSTSTSYVPPGRP